MKLRALWVVLYACALAFAAGCLERNGEEHAAYSPHLRSERASIPRVEDDDRLRNRIDAGDNLSMPVVLLHHAFVGGQEVAYLDFGAATATARAIWQFRRRNDAGELEEFGHPDLVDSAPGDMTYGPFRSQYLVLVTDAYRGERITSLSALEDALEIGLLEEPQPLNTYIDCPMVLSDTVIEDDGVTPRPPLELRDIYYRGHIATCYALLAPDGSVQSFPLDERGTFQARSAYALRRQDESRVLDEMVWMNDLNGDGDKRDSNLVFTVSMMQPGFAVLWRQVDVVVAPDYEFGAARAESDLFTREMLGPVAVTPPVIEYMDSTTLKNLVVWSVAQ